MNRILVVEDTQDNFDLIEDALEEKYELLHADNGRAGLSMAREAKPDLILLDMGLPEISGWEVARQLRADPAFAGTRVIALTAHAMDGDRERCLESGCDDYVSKPIDVSALVAMVDRFFASKGNAACSKS